MMTSAPQILWASPKVDQAQTVAMEQLEQQMLGLVQSLPWMLSKSGPGFVRKDGSVTLPDGTELIFTASLEIKE